MPLPSRAELQDTVSGMFKNMTGGGGNRQQPAPQNNQPQNNQQQNTGGSKVSNQPGSNFGGPQTSQNDPANRQGGGQTEQNNQTAESPFATFDKLMENMGNKGADQAPEFKLDPKVLSEATASMDFSSALPKELLAKFQGMGEQGSMFLEALNHMGRNIYSQSLQHGSALTGKFVGMRSDYDQSKLGQHVRHHVVRNSLKSSNNEAEHPLVANLRQNLADQLADAYPDAPPEWIDKQTRSFFVNSAKHLSPEAFEGTGDGRRQEQPEDVNWEDWAAGKAFSEARSAKQR